MPDDKFSIWMGNGMQPTIVRVDQPNTAPNFTHNFDNCVHRSEEARVKRSCCGQSNTQVGAVCKKFDYFPLVPDTCFKCAEFQQK